MKKENEISEDKEIEIEQKGESSKEEKQSEDNTKQQEKNDPKEQIKEEVNNEKTEVELEEKEDKKKISKLLIILLSIITIVILCLSTIFAILNMNNTNIIKGVHIEQVSIYGMTQEEVNKVINERISQISEIFVSYGEYSESIKLKDLGIEVNAKEAIQKAVQLGKTRNIIIDNYQILIANLFGEHFELTINIEEEQFSKMVKNIQAEIPESVKEYSYDIKDDKLIITNGKPGKIIKQEEFKENIIKNLKEQFNKNKSEILIPVEYGEPEEINIEKIYNEIYKEAKDAYIIEDKSKDVFELHKEENGVDLGVTLEEAKRIVAEEKDTYKIPLKITKPKIKVKDLGDKLFKQTLAKYTTIYDAGDINRGINIGLAAKAINGTILLPGEKFSYNGKVGDTTKEKGYRTGGAYVGGKVVQAYGGGICQLSSTLYNAVLYANLGIVERYNHSYAVGYVPAGRDATVSYGGKDFKFENTRSYPIKIVASAKNGVVSVSIMGVKEKTEYEIVLTSSVLSTKACETTYENNSNLEVGKENVIQKGYNGKTSVAYKIVKLNGKTISKTLLSKDTYKPMNKIIERGTKPVVSQPTTPTTPVVTEPTVPEASAVVTNTVPAV